MPARNRFVEGVWRPLSLALVVTTVFGLIVSVPAAANEPAITPGHTASPSGGTNAIGPGIDGANQNAQLGESLPASVYPSWSAQPAKCPEAATSEANTIAVAGSKTVVVDRQYGCSFVSAYDTTSGAVLWRRAYVAAGKAQVVGSVVYVVHNEDPSRDTYVDALSISSGAVQWSTPVTINSLQAPIAVGSGLVAAQGSVVDAATGKLKFHFPGSGGTPLIVDNVVYLNGQTVQAFSAAGKLLWTRTKPAKSGVPFGPGFGDARPSLHDGVLYITSPYADGPTSTATTLAIDPRTGKILRTLSPSGTALAFDGPVAIGTTTAHNDSTVVSAMNVTTGAVYWTTKIDPFLPAPASLNDSAPVVSNGLVWLLPQYSTGAPARLLALDEVTGATRSSVSQPCHAASGSLVIAQKRILTPSDCGVVTFTTTKPADLLADTGFETSVSGWSALPGGKLSRVTSPVHGGKQAAKISPATASPYTAGITHTAVVPNATAGKLYTVSCWVRATPVGVDLRAQIRELSPDLSAEVDQPLTSLGWIPANQWVQVTATSRATTSGNRMVPELTAGGTAAGTAAIFFDDCSVISG